MSMQDPIADMLTQIRNAQMMHKSSITCLSSNHKLAILKVLEEEGYIVGYTLLKGEPLKVKIELKYYQDTPVISLLRRISRPALRVYKSKDELPRVQGGFGIAVISTPKGVMSDKRARKLGQGGEVLCVVA